MMEHAIPIVPCAKQVTAANNAADDDIVAFDFNCFPLAQTIIVTLGEIIIGATAL